MASEQCRPVRASAPWAHWPLSHLTPRWQARDCENARAPTIRADDPNTATNSWEASEATQYTLERKDAGGRRSCTGSARSTVLLLTLAVLFLACAVMVAMTTTYSFYCLFLHRVSITDCTRHSNNTLVPQPLLQMGMRYTVSSVATGMVATLLFVLARYYSTPGQGIHLDILPIGIIWRNVHLTRKFWVQLFLVVGGVAFNIYTAYFRPHAGNSHAHAPVANAAMHRWFYTAATVDKTFLFAVMCIGNYTQPSPNAPYLTKFVFYLAMLYFTITNSIHFCLYSYHLTFKVLPGRANSFVGLKPATTSAMKKERVTEMIHFLLLILNAMLRASYWNFFAGKLFEPSKDFFHSVHHPIPAPAAAAPAAEGSGEQRGETLGGNSAGQQPLLPIVEE